MIRELQEAGWKWCWVEYYFGEHPMEVVRSARIFNSEKEAYAARCGYLLARKGLL